MSVVPSALLRRTAERLEATTVGRLVTRSAAGLIRIEVFDRAMTLAAQSFTSILPIVVAIAAFNPANADALGVGLSEQLGLPDAAAQAVEESLPDGETVQRTIGVLGLLLLLVSATSFSRAMQRMYLRVWDAPRSGGIRGAWRWLATVLGVSLALSALRLTHRVVDGWPYGDLVRVLVDLALWTVLWTVVPWLLLGGAVARRTLWATGALSAVALGAVTLAGRVYLPIALTTSARQLGALGIAIAYVGWLFVIAFGIVLAAVVGRAAALDEGALGRLVRGPAPPAEGDAARQATRTR